jgi:hypothetical protein
VLDDDDDDVDVELEPQVQVYDTGSEDPREESESGGLMVCGMGGRCCPGLGAQVLRYTCTALWTDEVRIVVIGLGPFSEDTAKAPCNRAVMWHVLRRN